MPDVTKFIADPPTALLIILILGAITAFALGKVVPRPFYDREVRRGDALAAAAETLVPALAGLTNTVTDKMDKILANQDRIIRYFEDKER